MMSTWMRARLKVELGVLPDIVQPKLALDRVCRRLGRVPRLLAQRLLPQRRLGRVPSLLAQRLLPQRAVTRPVQHQVQIVI